MASCLEIAKFWEETVSLYSLVPFVLLRQNMLKCAQWLTTASKLFFQVITVYRLSQKCVIHFKIMPER